MFRQERFVGNEDEHIKDELKHVPDEEVEKILDETPGFRLEENEHGVTYAEITFGDQETAQRNFQQIVESLRSNAGGHPRVELEKLKDRFPEKGNVIDRLQEVAIDNYKKSGAKTDDDENAYWRLFLNSSKNFERGVSKSEDEYVMSDLLTNEGLTIEDLDNLFGTFELDEGFGGENSKGFKNAEEWKNYNRYLDISGKENTLLRTLREIGKLEGMKYLSLPDFFRKVRKDMEKNDYEWASITPIYKPLSIEQAEKKASKGFISADSQTGRYWTDQGKYDLRGIDDFVAEELSKEDADMIGLLYTTSGNRVITVIGDKVTFDSEGSRVCYDLFFGGWRDAALQDKKI